MNSKIDKIDSEPSYIYMLVDSFTQSYPENEIGKIYLRSGFGIKYKPIVNLSRYHVFMGVPDGLYTLIIEETHYYEKKEENIMVLISKMNPKTSDIPKIELKPKFKI